LIVRHLSILDDHELVAAGVPKKTRQGLVPSPPISALASTWAA
jgi:hypothetical protein